VESLPIHPYDIFMLVVLVGTTIFGAWKGMAWQLASLASVVLSAMVAIHFSGPLAPLFSVNEPWNRFLAMLILYLATSLSIWVLFRLVAGILDRVRLKEFDRQLGAMFGFVKGVLLCVLITFFAVTLSETARQAVLRAKSGYYIAQLTRHAGPILPEEVRAVVGKYLDELDEKLQPIDPPEGDVAEGLDPEELKQSIEDLKHGINKGLDGAAEAVDEIGASLNDARDGIQSAPGER